VSQSPGKGPGSFCLSNRCSKISKWISFMYDLCTFDLVFFYWFPGQVSLCKPFKSEFLYLHFCSFPRHIPCWFSKQGVLISSLSWISCSSDKSSVPLRYLPTMEHHTWGVFFPLSKTVSVFILPNSVHPVSSSEGVIPMCSHRFVVFTGGNKLGIFPCCHLEPSYF